MKVFRGGPAGGSHRHPAALFGPLFLIFSDLKYFRSWLLFIYFWLCRVFTDAHGLSRLQPEGLRSSRSVWASRDCGVSCCGAQAPGRSGSAVKLCELSCSAARGTVSDQGSNPSAACIGRCVLNHWTAREAPPLILFCFSAVGVHINFPYSPFTNKSL